MLALVHPRDKNLTRLLSTVSWWFPLQSNQVTGVEEEGEPESGKNATKDLKRKVRCSTPCSKQPKAPSFGKSHRCFYLEMRLVGRRRRARVFFRWFGESRTSWLARIASTTINNNNIIRKTDELRVQVRRKRRRRANRVLHPEGLRLVLQGDEGHRRPRPILVRTVVPGSGKKRIVDGHRKSRISVQRYGLIW